MNAITEISRFCDSSFDRVIAVVVTRDRPALLRACLSAIIEQERPPDEILVVDNASGPETAAAIAEFPTAQTLRLPCNEGGAGGFHAGLDAALRTDARWVWVMDDDGRPHGPDCLTRLLQRARSDHAELVGPLVLDAEKLSRLAFPIRVKGRTLFSTVELAVNGPVRDFAHLFRAFSC